MKSHSQEIMLALDRLWWHNARARLRRWWRDDVMHAPLEPILHPSRLRLVGIGLFTCLGHLAYHVIWTEWLPQPYESLWARVCMAASSLVYFVIGWRRDFASQRSVRWFSLVAWLQLPWFFSWMYIMNDGNSVWLASMAAMTLIYYHFTDWRLASVGLLLGAVMGAATAGVLHGHEVHTMPVEHLLVWLFATAVGLLLGMSSANLRRVRLVNTLSTMGVMAHELRTPLATVHLMGDVLRNLAQQGPNDARRRKLEDLGGRLQNLVRGMNRHIDMQIANAQLMRLPREVL
jgi:two-component system, CAI-1 autoinducer sensor kinase/phosphatase CqsS